MMASIIVAYHSLAYLLPFVQAFPRNLAPAEGSLQLKVYLPVLLAIRLSGLGQCP